MKDSVTCELRSENYFSCIFQSSKKFLNKKQEQDFTILRPPSNIEVLVPETLFSTTAQHGHNVAKMFNIHIVYCSIGTLSSDAVYHYASLNVPMFKV